MLNAVILSLVLAQAGTSPAASPSAPAAQPAPSAPLVAPTAGAENLWLVAPLYPGQEILVGRTENAIHQLLPQGSTDQVGFAALQAIVKAHKGDVGCALGETTCTNPLDAYLRGLGLEKLVLIKGGQEEPDYTFQVTSINLATGETRAATGQGSVLEKALLAALVKVAPLASVLTVATTPPGVDLYVDNEKIGKTPYEGQILPGERTIKLSGQGFQDLTKTITVPARGKVALNETLQLLPSTLIVKPVQKTAVIYIDGKAVGTGDTTVPLTPGNHLLEAKSDGYQDYSKQITVAANGQSTEVPDLSPTPESGILKHSMYVEIGFEQQMLRQRHGTYRVNAAPFNKVDENAPGITNPPIGAMDQGNTGRGFNIDWGQQREHFGLLLLGFTYLSSSSTATRAFPDAADGSFNHLPGDPLRLSVPATYGDWYDLHFVQPQVNFIVWHIMGYAQAGLGVRALKINTPQFEDEESQSHKDGFLDVAPYAALKLGLRAYFIEGAYFHVSYRFTYVMAITGPHGFSALSPADGFDLGFGYAF